MATDIKRYSYDEGSTYRFSGHVEDSEGDFVKYEDHLAVVEQMRALAEAAWEVGYATGKAVNSGENHD